jgi:tight adherence protein B
MDALLLGLVFLGTVLLLVGTYAFVNRRRLGAAAEARARLAGIAGPQDIRIFRDESLSGLALLNALLAGRSFSSVIAAELRRAGSSRKVGEVVLMAALLSVIGFWIGQNAGALFALLFAVMFGMIPGLYIRRLQAKRLRRLEEQLPDALDIIVNALRAGYSLQAAMEFAGRELAAPLGPEFLRFYDEQRLGMDVRQALVRLEERVGTADMKMLVTSLLIQRETGGNLAEVLGNLAALVRERVAFRGHVETLTAEGKLSARFLTALPVLLFIALTVLNPQYERTLWTTAEGRMMLLYGFGSLAMGYVILKRIANIEL